MIQDAWKSHIKAAHKSITVLMKSRENKDNTKFVNYWGWSRQSEKLKNEALLLTCSFPNRIRKHVPKTCMYILKRKRNKEIKTKFQSLPHSILVQSHLIYSNSLDNTTTHHALILIGSDSYRQFPAAVAFLVLSSLPGMKAFLFLHSTGQRSPGQWSLLRFSSFR